MQAPHAPRTELHSFIVHLIEDWNRGRTQHPNDTPSATEVTRPIWDAEETGGTAYFPNDNASPLHLADLLKSVSKDYFGGHQWREMEDYINRLTPKERRNLTLDEFVGTFYNALRDFGTPDGGEEDEGRWPLGDFAGAAKLMFDVRAMPFVKSAWTHIEGSNRPDYPTLLEETQAKVRLMALACICLEFSNLSLEQEEQPDFELWAEVLEVPAHCLGQLIGTTDAECNRASNEAAFRDRALTVLTDRCRAALFAALVEACDGVDRLHAALLQSCPASVADDDPAQPAIANNLTYAFVAGGLVCRRAPA